MIEVKQLTQTYKSGKGVFDLDFSIKKGEVFGFLGPNGAGKTTTIRNILGYANTDKGSASINGLDCRKDAAELQKIVGYLPGEIAFFDHMKGMEFLKFVGDMHSITDNLLRDQLIEQFELDASGGIRKMSKGMKQKLLIITALIHNPRIIILDEPLNGLDANSVMVFKEILTKLAKAGRTIFYSSHLMDVVEKISDRIILISDGVKIADGTFSDLKEQSEKGSLETIFNELTGFSEHEELADKIIKLLED